jgi:hypothetical protein
VADLVLSAEDVGRIVQYVAPGFFARVAYQARFPRDEPSTVNLLLWSVAASLPLVALGGLLADALGIARSPTSWSYLVILLLPAALSGYAVAALRDRKRVRSLLGKLGLHHQPHGSLYAMTMLDPPAGAGVLVEFEDGRRLWGWPAAGPSSSEDGIEEIVITSPEWWSTVSGEWTGEGAGRAILVRLDQVSTITFSWDPFPQRA